MRQFLAPLFLLLSLAGCDQVNQTLGLEDPAKKEARQTAEGTAVGGACRHSGRAIEDCYAIYTWLPKAAVFGGWRDMDAYMRENDIETVAPQLPPPEPPGSKRRKRIVEPEEIVVEEKPAKKMEDKSEAAPDKLEKLEKAGKPIEKPAEKSVTSPEKTAVKR